MSEFQAAEQQVVGVGGHALQLQPTFVVKAIELGLDVVFGGRQERQGIAQHRVVGFELVHQPGFFLHCRLVGGLRGLPTAQVDRVVVGVAAVQFGPDPRHLREGRDQGIIVVCDRDPGLEHFAVPLRIELLQLADQVPRLGVAGGLVTSGLQVQKHQSRGQQ